MRAAFQTLGFRHCSAAAVTEWLPVSSTKTKRRSQSPGLGTTESWSISYGYSIIDNHYIQFYLIYRQYLTAPGLRNPVRRVSVRPSAGSLTVLMRLSLYARQSLSFPPDPSLPHHPSPLRRNVYRHPDQWPPCASWRNHGNS